MQLILCHMGEYFLNIMRISSGVAGMQQKGVLYQMTIISFSFWQS